MQVFIRTGFKHCLFLKENLLSELKRGFIRFLIRVLIRTPVACTEVHVDHLQSTDTSQAKPRFS